MRFEKKFLFRNKLFKINKNSEFKIEFLTRVVISISLTKYYFEYDFILTDKTRIRYTFRKFLIVFRFTKKRKYSNLTNYKLSHYRL